MRIPLADTTIFRAPPDVPDKLLVLMADIFPTGYFGARNAFNNMSEAQRKDSVVVLIGCGPVGLCALVNALDYKPKHLLAVDSIEPRLEQAKKLGAEPWNFQTNREGLNQRVKDLTDGRGADAAIEVVGLSPALRMGFELIRPWGVRTADLDVKSCKAAIRLTMCVQTISSIGVHNGEIPWTGNEAYGKNLRLQMGRCPVRSIFPEALEALKKKHHLLKYVHLQRIRTHSIELGSSTNREVASCLIRSCQCPKLLKVSSQASSPTTSDSVTNETARI